MPLALMESWTPIEASLTRPNRAAPAATRDDLVLGDYKPDATTTGVLPGSSLTIVTTHVPVSNTTYENLDIRTAVLPGSSVGNVTYKNCYFRGGATAPTAFTGLYRLVNTHQRGFTFIDCTFRPQTPSWFWIGLHGYGFTARRCDISNMVDAMSTFNNNNGPAGSGDDSLRNGPVDVVVEQCYVHDQGFWSNPPDNTSSDGSHADGIQIQGGSGYVIRGNNFTGKLNPIYAPNWYGHDTSNAVFMIKPDVGLLSNVTITDNWLDGGAVTINVSHDTVPVLRKIVNLGVIKRNRFGRGQRLTATNGGAPYCVLRPSDVTVDWGVGTADENVHDDDDTTITIRNG